MLPPPGPSQDPRPILAIARTAPTSDPRPSRPNWSMPTARPIPAASVGRHPHRLKKRRDAITKAIPTTLIPLGTQATPQDTHSHPRDFLRKGARVCRVPEVLPPMKNPRPGRHATRPRRLAFDPQTPPDSSRHCQPVLATVLRAGIRRDRKRLRPAGRPALSSRVARLARQRVHPPWLGRQGPAPSDRHQRDLPPEFGHSSGTPSNAIHGTGFWLDRSE
ncbi:MAG: hypothetical protein Ct9H300mP1_00250 [Planctomycetaceae bacterium]|nr:MAG: hypothetical protein Ct9H300mP1_00250 [Planctomycetaceae bacterium]